MGGPYLTSALEVGITNNGLVGSLYNGLTGHANELMCFFMGPGFLSVLYNKRGCPNEIFMPSIFNSYVEFCKYYNDLATPSAKKCLTDAAVDIKVYFKGIIGGSEIIGNCCNHCAEKAKGDSTMTLSKNMFQE